MIVASHIRPNVSLAPTGQIFVKLIFWEFFENMSRIFNFDKNLKRITDALHEHQYTLFILSRLVLLRMRNVADKICRENQNTHFMFCNFFPKILWFMR
jgi:hypothetical protein